MIEDKVEPTLESPTDFQSIHKVIELSQKLAAEAYERALKGYMDLPEGADRLASIIAVQEAMRSIELADDAQRSFLGAASSFRQSTVKILENDIDAATESAKQSSQKLLGVAQSLHTYGDSAPKSKFFSSILNAASSVDAAVGRLEDTAALKAAEFSAGLKEFSRRVVKFSEDVAKFPGDVVQRVKEAGISTGEAVANLGSRFSESFKSMLSKGAEAINKFTDTAKDSAKSMKASSLNAMEGVTISAENKVGSFMDSAQSILAECTAAAKKLGNQVAKDVAAARTNAVDIVSRHGAVIAGMGKDAINNYADSAEKALDRFAAEYKTRLNAVDMNRTMQEAANRPNNSIQTILLDLKIKANPVDKAIAESVEDSDRVNVPERFRG